MDYAKVVSDNPEVMEMCRLMVKYPDAYFSWQDGSMRLKAGGSWYGPVIFDSTRKAMLELFGMVEEQNGIKA